MRSFALLLLSICAAGFAHADDHNFNRTVTADPKGTVEISNVSGRVYVTAWDNPQVEIHGDLGTGVSRVDVETSSGRTTIKVVVPNTSFQSISTTLRVKVPRQSELDISGVSADVDCVDVQGSLQLKTVSGNVKADVFTKDTEIKTVSGDVVLRGAVPSSAKLHVTTISGNVRIDHGSGDFDATTVSGDMNIHLDPTSNVRVRTTSGDFDFEGKLTQSAAFEVETVSGDLIVRAVPHGSLAYEVHTFSGDIKDCMGVEAERVSKYGPGKRLIGSKGDADTEGARIRLKTMSGDVELCDKG
jgi:DUF4097 and DUF4098 domain-containing protein YvlB